MDELSVTKVIAAYFSQPKGKTGVFFAVLAELFTHLFGGWDALLTTLVLFMVFDYLSGLAVAVKGKSKKTKTGKLSSKAGWDGLLKKGITLMIVLLACRLDLTAAQLGVDMFINIRVVVIGFYIGVEGLSLLENYLAIGGEKVPPILKKALERLLESGGIDDESITDRTEPN